MNIATMLTPFQPESKSQVGIVQNKVCNDKAMEQ